MKSLDTFKSQNEILAAMANTFNSSPMEISEGRIAKTTEAMITEAMPVFTLYFPDFQSKYGQADPDTLEAVMREYSKQLIKNGVTRKGFEIGLERLRKESTKIRFMPNPQAFAEMCKPRAEDLGLPSFTDAKAEIVKARGINKGKPTQFTHQIVELLNLELGLKMYELSDRKWTIQLQERYEKLIDMAMAGTLPEPLERLAFNPSQGLTPAQKEAQRRGESVLSNTTDPLLTRIKSLREAKKCE